MPAAGRARGGGFNSLGSLGSVTAWGLTHRVFLERQRFELFFRNQRNQTAERKLLARKSSVLKALDSVLWAFAGSDRRLVEHLFSAHVAVGGGQKSGIFRRGPHGSAARISAKFRKLFLLGNRGSRTGCKNVAKFRVGGG